MPIVYNTAVKTARMTETRDYFAGGTLELLSALDQVLAIFTLTGSGGSIAGDQWTIDFANATVQGEDAAGAGTTATKAQIKTSGGLAHITGLTVGVGSGDVNLNNNSISDGQDVTLTSATITHGA